LSSVHWLDGTTKLKNNLAIDVRQLLYMGQQNKVPDPYRCESCNKHFVVSLLARCCEMKHDGAVFERRPEQEPRPKSNKKTKDV
jgi:hypothetical protein